MMSSLPGVRGNPRGGSSRRASRSATTALIPELGEKINYYIQPTGKNINTILHYNGNDPMQNSVLESIVYRFGRGSPVLEKEVHELVSFLVNKVHIDTTVIQTNEQLCLLCEYLNKTESPLIWTLVPEYIDSASCMNLIHDMKHVQGLDVHAQRDLLDALRKLHSAMITPRGDHVVYGKNIENIGTDSGEHEFFE